MIIKFHLLQERVKYIKDEFGNIKTSEPDEKGFVEIEIENPGASDFINMFHAGFECGFEYRKKNAPSWG
jgi:hypothetical protein